MWNQLLINKVYEEIKKNLKQQLKKWIKFGDSEFIFLKLKKNLGMLFSMVNLSRHLELSSENAFIELSIIPKVNILISLLQFNFFKKS